ncbi:MAG: PGPGW domain-containing protein [Candidatus Binatia bacterium]
MFKRFFGQYETVRKVVVGILGLSVILLGALMVFLPGPAIIVIPAGLAILATEFAWARMILTRLKKKLQWRANGKTATDAEKRDGKGMTCKQEVKQQ